ncbi:hypothetical protein HMPREF0083_06210 [Aneurinibacillus aneurinilyticus ATCC 12856]|uniref:Uncharacterized protein n=1 Tax=Aneurinibacillus aneurinilyticus ATCC 12856 TaxID=649747 RepID=U1XV71_ANEAE|nr:hypothetical protein HMPREF0083_06210 [Aneurinibacillus aneurinilyticus ATCC 12856]
MNYSIKRTKISKNRFLGALLFEAAKRWDKLFVINRLGGKILLNDGR